MHRSDSSVNRDGTFLASFGRMLDRNLGILFLIPGLAVLCAVIVYPIIANIYLSMTDTHLIYPGRSFVGLANFAKVLGDARFWTAARNSIVWTVSSVALQLLLGMGVALLLNRPLKGMKVFRVLVLIPYAFPPVAVALIWRWMLNGAFGVVNTILADLGIISEQVSWLGSADTALATAIGVNVWFGYPLFAISILAALQSIPKEYYEVAQIEGASGWQTFWHVILPSIRTVVSIMVVLRTIWVFNGFDILFMLTGGGPGRSTETLPIYTYLTGWGYHMIGESAAIAVILFVFLGLASVLWFRLIRKGEEA